MQREGDDSGVSNMGKRVDTKYMGKKLEWLLLSWIDILLEGSEEQRSINKQLKINCKSHSLLGKLPTSPHLLQ
jgi:hypothetical protein